MTRVVLGIDTSNYTTSLALVSLTGEVILDSREVLPVNMGEVGLRQSDALFLHVRNWPVLLEKAQLTGYRVCAVAVSSRPAPREDSYMPVFLAGKAFASSIARALGVSLLETSHQEGHIRAALTTRGLLDEPFLVVQISGGTTDVLYVVPSAGGGFRATLLGRSGDIHAGQFIDRVGVHMGLVFPCGAAMDALASTWEVGGGQPYPITSSIKDGQISFSGPATMAIRALGKGSAEGAVALGVFRCISNSLEKVLRPHRDKASKVLLCGGVAANTHIRRRLTMRLRSYDFMLAPSHLAGDNAVGIALLGMDRMQSENGLC